MGQYASNFAITNPILGGVATIMEKVGSPIGFPSAFSD
jgi:hypothetical protein